MVTSDDGVDIARKVNTMCDLLMKHTEKFLLSGNRNTSLQVCGCVLESNTRLSYSGR